MPYDPYGFKSTQPVTPDFNMPGNDQSGGVMDFLKGHLGDILQFGGNFLGGMGEANKTKEQAREFNANYELNRNSQTAQIQNQLNRAPLADKGQYLAMNMAAPTPFQPRDYTQGLSHIQPGQQAQGGAQAQLAANAAAAPNYREGAGGVDTSALQAILSRLTGQPPKSGTNTINYAGQQYTPQQWSAYLNAHPDVARSGV